MRMDTEEYEEIQREDESFEQEEYEFCVGILKAVQHDLSKEQFAYVALKLGIDRRVVDEH